MYRIKQKGVNCATTNMYVLICRVELGTGNAMLRIHRTMPKSVNHQKIQPPTHTGSDNLRNSESLSSEGWRGAWGAYKFIKENDSPEKNRENILHEKMFKALKKRLLTTQGYGEYYYLL